jgi:glutamate synthase (NADPH/NADH) small chain
MLCPKCHQPLADEDDGVYICCADAAMQWQCGQCGKVSEGFAFPYGSCPQCGGKLALREGGGPVLADQAAMDAVRMAFEIELGGRAFYQRAAAESGDDELRSLFGRFAAMEGEHMETLIRRYHVQPPVASPDFRVELAAIFAGVEHRPQDPDNLFRIAIALEERAAAFFATRAGAAAAGSPEQRLYIELGAEEREHASLLATEYKRWRERKPGLFSGA